MFELVLTTKHCMLKLLLHFMVFVLENWEPLIGARHTVGKKRTASTTKPFAEKGVQDAMKNKQVTICNAKYV